MKVLGILATLNLVYLSTDAQNFNVLLATLLRPFDIETKGVIFQLLDGKIQAVSDNFTVTKLEANNVGICFAYPDGFTSFPVANVTYSKIKADSRTIYGKKASGGIVCGSGKRSGICVLCTGNKTSWCAVVGAAVSRLAKYFYQVSL